MPANSKITKSKKYMFLVLGLICLVLAYIGIAMPGIPGTPFIILTAYFFIRSSERLYAWILKNKIFSSIIHKFKDQERISFKTKLLFLVPVWISAIVADILFAKTLSGHIIVLLAITAYTIVILLLKKLKI